MRLSLVFIIGLTLWSCSKTRDTKIISNKADSLVVSTGEHLIITTQESVGAYDTTHFDYDALYKLESYLTKRTIDKEKLDTISSDCAILIYPTDEQIEEMKKEEGEDFYTIADDNSWYQGMAIGMIDSVGITKTTANGQFLRLKGQQKTWDLDIRKKNLPAWNIVFFKTTKEPMIVSTIDLTVEQIKDYFEIRE